MSDSEGKYTYSSLVVGLHFLLFFLGVFVCIPAANYLSFNYTFVFITFFIGIFVTVSLSFINKSIIGGFILGLTQALSFWVGFLTSVLITGIYDSSLTVLNAFGIYALIVTFAFAVTGLFFGLLGYIAHHMFFEEYSVETFIFRDYWSNVYNLGKNNKREYNDLDRRLNNIHLSIKDWWKNIIWRASKPKPELAFVPQIKADPSLHKNKKKYRVGDIFEINSGEHLFSEVIDPSDLIAAYRPSVLNIPAISNHIGGGRKLAFEEVVSRFLGWFIESKFLWALYLSLSVMLGFFSLNYFNEYSKKHGITLIQSDITNIIIICILVSALTLFFVWQFQIISKKLYDKRPDERLLSFSIYLIFVLLYPLYYQLILSVDAVILNILSFFEVGSGIWITWIQWLSVLTIILGLAYIFIHRESEVSNIYFYDKNSVKSNRETLKTFNEIGDIPYWLESDGTSQYWVLRFMYFWRYELTFPPHPDWERVEIWVDAKSGDAKWIVSDYHYRELWYKVEKDITERGVILGFLTNFHTPIPFVTIDEVDRFSTILDEKIRNLLQIILTGKIEFNQPKEDHWSKLHPPEWIEKFGLTGVAASFCSNLKWSYWRYPWGIDNIQKYTKYPSTLSEEQPNNFS